MTCGIYSGTINFGPGPSFAAQAGKNIDSKDLGYLAKHSRNMKFTYYYIAKDKPDREFGGPLRLAHTMAADNQRKATVVKITK